MKEGAKKILSEKEIKEIAEQVEAARVDAHNKRLEMISSFADKGGR